ncbi:hypothetical protein TNIN_415011 [Trichonephila inaurata madagascariensis]|uniref:Uncharacterized protein n=1 Tax=Trichonephila inaurata madagascariensis TaxID=2747483 RepID=A0A8X6WUP2_9ARAC|nr:hypothetical protein TNIN_415011 [Trichonephila inaurata madagascariensis]
MSFLGIIRLDSAPDMGQASIGLNKSKYICNLPRRSVQPNPLQCVCTCIKIYNVYQFSHNSIHHHDSDTTHQKTTQDISNSSTHIPHTPQIVVSHLHKRESPSKITPPLLESAPLQFNRLSRTWC